MNNNELWSRAVIAYLRGAAQFDSRRYQGVELADEAIHCADRLLEAAKTRFPPPDPWPVDYSSPQDRPKLHYNALENRADASRKGPDES